MSEEELREELLQIELLILKATEPEYDFDEKAEHIREAMHRARIHIGTIRQSIAPITAAIAVEEVELAKMETRLREIRVNNELDLVKGALLKGRDQILAELDELRAASRVDRELASRLCSNCGKRPRHFDDLCKRCANSIGARPTGKVS